MKYVEKKPDGGLILHRVFSHNARALNTNTPSIIKCDQIKTFILSVMNGSNKFLPQAQMYVADIIGVLPRKERDDIQSLRAEQHTQALMDYLKKTPDFCLSFDCDGRLAYFLPLNDKLTNLRHQKAEGLRLNTLAL